jgi:uncharacterized protein YggU (UPF0235/DUF167 family)
MGTISVRVTPRSARPGVTVEDGQVTIRVRAPAEGGRATEEARRALASALGIPPSGMALRSGVRSRRKVFEVRGMASEDVLRRLGGA